MSTENQTHKNISRDDIIQDIQRIDDNFDSLNPEVYSVFGKYSFDDVVEKFGNWQTAVDEAGTSIRKKLIKDVIRVSNEQEDTLSLQSYLEKGSFSLGEIRDEYGTWNKLKNAAGLEINGSISREELEEDMKSVANELSRPLTADLYNKHGKYSAGVFIQRDYTFAEFRDKIGLEQPERKTSEYILESWKKELKDVKGRFTFPELKEKVSGSKYPLTKRGVADLLDHLSDSDFQFTRSHGGSRAKYYVEGPEAQTLEQYYQQFLDKIPESKENWFREISGTGPSPKSIVAAIRYLTEDKTQAEIAEEEDVTHVALRSTKNKIIEKFNLEEDAGKEKIVD